MYLLLYSIFVVKATNPGCADDECVPRPLCWRLFLGYVSEELAGGLPGRLLAERVVVPVHGKLSGIRLNLVPGVL